MGTATARRSYRPDIDGLRAIAILSVVLYHAGFNSGGFTGVDIFFAISGYLIGGHIYSELEAGTFSYPEFYRRRAKRILPAYYVVLAALMLAGLMLFTPSEMMETAKSIVAAVLSVSNIFFRRQISYFNPTNDHNPLLMTWSLGVEEQFYLLIAPAMVLLARLRRNAIVPLAMAMCILFFLLAAIEVQREPISAFYLLPARVWELGVGVTLAIVEQNASDRRLSGTIAQVVSFAGITAALLPVFLLTSASHFPGPGAIPTIFGTASLIATPSSWINRRLLSAPPLVFIGRISYSFYLWHWPLSTLAEIVYVDKLPEALRLAIVGVAFGAAVVSYVLVEQPFRRSSSAPIPLLIRYAAVGVLLAVAGGGILRSDGFPRRFPTLVRSEVELQNGIDRRDECLQDAGSYVGLNYRPECFDLTSGSSSVAVWGDSHAAAMAPGIRKLTSSADMGLVVLSMGDCEPLIDATIVNPKLPTATQACIAYKRKVLSLLEDTPRIRVVILSSAWVTCTGVLNDLHGDTTWLRSDSSNSDQMPPVEPGEALFRQSLAGTVGALVTLGKTVVLLGDAPAFEVDPVSRFRTAQIPIRHALAEWLGAAGAHDSGFDSPAFAEKYAESRTTLRLVSAQFANVEVFDVKPKFCANANLCPYRLGDQLLYSDWNHLTPDGALYALKDFDLPEPFR